MASCVGNIRTKNYQNLIIGFQVAVKYVGYVFLRHSVVSDYTQTGTNRLCWSVCSECMSALSSCYPQACTTTIPVSYTSHDSWKIISKALQFVL